MANVQKTDIVSSVEKSLQDSKNFALVQFDKTTHKDLEGLRRDLRKQDAEIKVIKNTLFEKAVNKLSQTQKEFQHIREAFFPLKDKS
ncbi:50S ribosomal protein L10, partial [Candidatus Woesebacteria bacterium]|nr:50S ribosomal protein L10 [Candidatus Woesebacteria bacterium]